MIELLVVMAIILVLTSLVMSSLQDAHGKAVRIHCASNLRQTGIALQVYLQENGVYPLASAGNGLGNWQVALRLAATEQVLYCPLWSPASDEFLQYFPTNTSIYTHYGYNALGAVRVNTPAQNPGLGGTFVWSGLGTGNYVPARENWVRVPSQMIAVGDSRAFMRPPLVPASLTPADPLYLAYPFVMEPLGYSGVNSSHAGGANMIFCDGHAEYARQSVWMAPTDASKRLWNNDNQSHPEFQ